MGASKTADEYIRDHWIPRKIWNNLNAPKHQERLKKCAELTRGAKLADVGCACGHSTEIMRDFKPGDWRGIDFSAAAINGAKDFFPNGTWGYIQNLDALHNLKRFGLDSIVCSEVLEHVVDDRKLVEGLWAAVSQRVVFTTPSVHVNDPGHIRLYDEAMLHDLFEGIPHTIENANRFFYIVCDEELGETAPEPVPLEELVDADDYLIPPGEEAAPVGLTAESVTAAYDKADEEPEEDPDDTDD